MAPCRHFRRWFVVLYAFILTCFPLARSAERPRVITTLAGTGTAGYSGDNGPASQAQLNNPYGIVRGPDGALYVCEVDNHIIRRVARAGTVATVAGNGQRGYSGDGGPAEKATLSGPKGLSLGPDGNVYLADTESHSIRMIDVKTGRLELIAGTGERGDGPDGDPLKCKMSRPHGVFVDADGSILVGDSEAHRVRVIRRR